MRPTHLRDDVRVALRILRRSPVFALTAILSIAIGVGANVAIFSFVNAVILRVAPVSDPASLAMLSRVSDPGRRGSSFPYPFFLELRSAPPAGVRGLFARATVGANAMTASGPHRVAVELVSPGFFDVIGVPPAAGRGISPADAAPGAEPVVVLSDAYWRSVLGAEREVTTRTVEINGIRAKVVGIAPPSFHGLDLGSAPDMWAPIELQPAITNTASRLSSPAEWWLQITARLDAAAAQASVASELSARFNTFVTGYAPQATVENTRVQLVEGARGQPSIQSRLGRPLLVLSGLCAATLLLVCLNVTNLLLGRVASRRQELAIRAAIGAGRGRLASQLFVEAAVLVVIGSAAGIGLVRWIAPVLVGLAAPVTAGAPLEVPFDHQVLLFVVAAVLCVTLFCGLWPAWSSARGLSSLARSSRGSTGGSRLTGRRWLVGGQIAVALALVVGASLLARTLVNLRNVETGADAHHVVMLRVDPTQTGLSPERAAVFQDDVIARVRALPSTVDAAEAVIPILSNNTWGSGVVLDSGVRDGRPERNAISPGYFRTLGTSVVEGREFTDADGPTAARVAIVNETFARLFLDGRAIGRRIGPAETTGRAEATVVGVVRDGKYSSLREGDVPMWFIPRVQLEELGHSDTAERIRSGVATLYVRMKGDPAQGMAAVVRAIGEVNPRASVTGTKTVAEHVDDQLAVERLLARLAVAFAAVAFFLAGLGLYGVTAYDVATRTREFGVRLAVGATRGRIIRLVLKQASPTIACGVAAGLLGSLGLVQTTRTLLFGIDPVDPFAFAAATMLIAVVSILAAAIPAFRAGRINPAELLR